MCMTFESYQSHYYFRTILILMLIEEFNTLADNEKRLSVSVATVID